MMIHSPILLWAVIQVLIRGSQTKPHATPSEDACIDISPNCAHNEHQCLTSSYVQGRCKKTCNLCEPDECRDHWPGLCIDKVDAGACSCAEARTNGWCQNNSFVIDNCRETCGFCQNQSASLCENQSPVCTVVENSCEDINICFPNKKVQRLCAQETCSRCGVDQGERYICSGSQLFDAQTKQCTSRPKSNDLCPPPTPPKSSCSTVESTCKRYEDCNPYRRIQTLCQTEECTRDGQYLGQRDMCFVQGELYDLETRRCVKPPTGSALCPNQSVVCRIVESSCETYVVYIPLKREQKLCKRESCTIGGVIQGEQNKCSGAMLYDTQTRTCVAKPTVCPIDTRSPGSCQLRNKIDLRILSDDPSANCRGPVGGPSDDCPLGLLCCQDACAGPVCKNPQ